MLFSQNLNKSVDKISILLIYKDLNAFRKLAYFTGIRGFCELSSDSVTLVKSYSQKPKINKSFKNNSLEIFVYRLHE